MFRRSQAILLYSYFIADPADVGYRGYYLMLSPVLPIEPAAVFLSIFAPALPAAVFSGWEASLLAVGLAVGLGIGIAFTYRDRKSRRQAEQQIRESEQRYRTDGSTLDLTERQRAEERLRDHERQYRSIFESTTDALLIFDYDGRLIEVNPAACRMHGYEYAELIGMRGTELLHPDYHGKFASFIKEVSAGREFHATGTHFRKDGSSLDVEVVGTSFVFAGRPALLAVVRDKTEERKAVEALRESEALLRFALESTQVGQWDLDLQNGVVRRSLRHAEIFGYDSAEGEWDYDIFLNRHVLPADRAAVDQAFRAALAGDKKWDMECRIARTDQEIRWIWTKGSVYRTEDGRPSRMAGLVMDITGRKQAEQALRESEERFRDLADNISQFAWMADEKGWIFWYNRRWFEYTGTTLEQMQGWGWRAVHHPDHVDRVVERLQRSWDTGEPWEDTFPLRGKDGNYRWFLSRALPIRDDDGKIIRWFGTNTDITDQRQLQEDLRHIAAQLSEADRRKDEFLATLAHELRNPLAPIRTGLEVLRLGQNDPETVEQIRSTMERQTQQLIALVDDLLDISRITRGKLELRKCQVDLGEVVNNAVEASRPFIDDANHRLSVTLPGSPVVLHADPNRLAQVLSNLLNNAAKYTPEGGRIDVTAKLEGDDISVSVKDTGIGIPPDMLGRVFEMFSQIDRPMERGYTGLGIGLTLVKSLVEMHGGRVEVHSEGVNRGSEFRVQLPILQQRAAEGFSVDLSAEPSAARMKRRVLVVDDNKAAAQMLAMVVKMLGNEVRTAHDGEEATLLSADFRPEVVLMDIGMPKMNGYEAARYIRSQAWGKNILLVALTGWGQEEDKRRTRQAGFDYHLVKPAEPAELQQLLAQSQG